MAEGARRRRRSRRWAQALGDELTPFVYRRFLDFGTLEDLKAMKRRVDASLRDPRARERNVKLGRGGIREVEFWVQAQQLIHGGKDPRLRVRGTLGALARLADAGYAAPEQAAALAAAYRFLRDVEHKLQIVHERQTQIIPSDPDELRALVRRLGLTGPDGEAGVLAPRTPRTPAPCTRRSRRSSTAPRRSGGATSARSWPP